MAGERRVGRRQAFEQVVDRVRAAGLRRRQPHAVGAETVARDLVDEDRVEVVHGRVAVAVEGAGADGGQRGGDRGQRALDALVEGGAPERVPPALAVVEEGMDETFGDGPPRQLDDGEDRTGARAELEARRRRPGERDRAAAGSRRRAAIPRPARGRSAIAGMPARRSPAESDPSRAAREDDRRRVVLPDDLEGRGGRARAQFGCGLSRHRPIRVGVKDDDPRPPDAYAPLSSRRA